MGIREGVGMSVREVRYVSGEKRALKGVKRGQGSCVRCEAAAGTW